jgi:hypothetical protein
MRKYIPSSVQDVKKLVLTSVFIAAAFFLVLGANGASAQSADPVQSGSVGLTGTISAPPPSQGATISFPTNGATFSEVPIIITGICPDGLLVKLFKNNVFGGSVQCVGGNFSIQSDLFTGANELIARVYDDLDQPGPDSNSVTVTFQSNTQGAPSRVTLTSNYAKRGANPGQKLTWPVILSGGSGPYAFSVDWGDGSEPDLFTNPFAGTVDLSHEYSEPGVYNIVVKAVDSNGAVAFLQLVGVANGPLSQDTNSDGSTGSGDGSGSAGGSSNGNGFNTSKSRIVWWPATLIVPFVVSTFWLGKKYMIHVLKSRIERGEHPFADV